MDKDFIKKSMIRLPESLYKEVEQIAKKNRRSINSTLIIAIEQYIEKEKSSHVE